MNLIQKANQTYLKHFNKETYFERALFFSWYCGLGDCTFCYMSINQTKQDPKKAKRTFSSILAETLISKELNWKIEFISGGYQSYTKKELLFLIKAIHSITKEKQWLNIGTLNKKELTMFKPFTKGYAGTIETVNWELRKKVCPSKTLQPILKTFQHCDELKLKKAITIILGLGETIKDFQNLKQFIKQHKISKVTFYTLNPHPGTPFKNPPTKKYASKWIAKTRIEFPKLHIIAGAWIDKTDYYSALLKAGANNITKMPSIRKFNSKELKNIESEVKKAGRIFKSKLTKLPDINWDKKILSLNPKIFPNELKKEITIKLNKYLKQMKKHN
ncbi:radical SAM protein [Candidatus Woesearchaeota archaeon]|nr:radical SAM protein [Candidatus Woesearchaeota archaeon]